MKSYRMVTIAAAAASAGALLTQTQSAEAQGPMSAPQGMVSFFQKAKCPLGWSDVSAAWQGRYVVIAGNSFGEMVGTPLSPGENRVTGDHDHSGSIAFMGGNCPVQPTGKCANWADSGIGRVPVTIGRARALNPGETIKPGTNAPYVTLRACVKN